MCAKSLQKWSDIPFGEVIEERWEKHGRSANLASLHRRLVGIGYEGFRQMVAGQLAPREDIMEQVADILGIDPREFPEYRRWQVEQTLKLYPDALAALYPIAMRISIGQSGHPPKAR